MELLNGSVVGALTVVSLRRTGDHSITYIARDDQTLALCVLVECFPKDCAMRDPDDAESVLPRSAEDSALLDQAIAGFHEKACRLRDLGSAIVPRCVAVFQKNFSSYAQFKLEEGGVADWAEPQPVADPEQFVSAAKTAMERLRFLEERGVSHGAIEPTSLRTDRSPSVLEGWLDAYPGAVRTGDAGDGDAFLSPERAEVPSAPESLASDIYSLSASLYWLASGHSPVAAAVRWRDVSAGRPDPLVPLSAYGVAAGLAATWPAIEAGLRVDPRERLRALELWRRFRADRPADEAGPSVINHDRRGWRSNSPSVGGASGMNADRRHSMRRIGALAAAVVLCLAGLAGGGYYVFSRRSVPAESAEAAASPVTDAEKAGGDQDFRSPHGGDEGSAQQQNEELAGDWQAGELLSLARSAIENRDLATARLLLARAKDAGRDPATVSELEELMAGAKDRGAEEVSVKSVDEHSKSEVLGNDER